MSKHIPEARKLSYDLRPRAHWFTLPSKDELNNFIPSALIQRHEGPIDPFWLLAVCGFAMKEQGLIHIILYLVILIATLSPMMFLISDY